MRISLQGRAASLHRALAVVAASLLIGAWAPVPAQVEALSKVYLEARAAGRWDDAERAMRQALAYEERAYGASDPRVAVSLSLIADVVGEAGRYDEAERLLRRALEIRRAKLGEHDASTALSYSNLAYVLDGQGRYAEAEPLLRRALEISRATLGEHDAATATNYNNLAANQSAQGKAAEAEALYRKALEVRLAAQGEHAPETATAFANLASVVNAQGRHAEAEPLFAKALKVRRAAPEPRELGVATGLNDLAFNLADQGRFAEAQPLLTEALEIRVAVLGDRHPDTAASRNNLAANLNAQGRYAEAEPLLRGALEVFQAALGAQHPTTAFGANNLAVNLNAQGRYGEAEPFYRKALEIRRAALGEAHPTTASSYNNVAVNLQDQGRFAEAEPLLDKALAIRQAALGDDHPETARSYGNLAAVLNAQGRYTEAEPLFRKALQIRRAALGEPHPLTAASEDSLAANLDDQGRIAEAESLYRQALAGRREALGDRHPLTATSLNNLAYNLDSQRRYAEAEPLYRQALEIRTAELGARHPHTATSINNLAAVLESQGRLQEAEALYRQALDVRLGALGAEHPDTAVGYANLAFNLNAQARYAQAEPYAARAAASTRRLRLRERGVASDRGDEGAVRVGDSASFRIYLAAAAGLAEAAPRNLAAVRGKAFLAAQDLDQSAAGEALAQAAARVAAGRAGLADVVRRRQNLSVIVRGDDTRLLAALGQDDAANISAMRQALARSTQELLELQAEIRARFPRYAELVSPEALGIQAVQARLGPGEGLLLVVPSNADLHVFAVSRSRVAWRRVAGGAGSVAAAVSTLRCQTDPDTCQAPPRAAEDGDDDLPGFDHHAAYGLYRDLVRPVEAALAGVRTLYVVSTGPLSGLPLGVLQTAPPPSGARGARALADAPWLADRYALVTLPSVSSLRALSAARPDPGRHPLAAYGDPVLSGYEAPGATRGALRAFRGLSAEGAALADPTVLRQGLAALPGTRVELQAMARALGAPASALHMGPQATEAAVKASPDLAQAQVVIFATHGLLPRTLEGLEEPGLVLTPPAVPTAQDDGLLTASEAARLRLSADWVILSACNTAAADGTPGAESLSGLAKAFLYAGASALMVSHWQVGDDVTAALTVQTIALQRADPSLSKAQALQAAMRAVRTGRSRDGRPLPGWSPIWAHPGSWAPFVLVSAGD
ncbi:CHAT domain-containing tetratricopeptide repeat protein [Phenylobacterium sp.]|uniref:CHAT domain-containing tetratricopeptide repeat protein n=1 Tax=Phenylobacterium sp. TaxID=1871053 RepID=UPI00301D5CC9